MATDLLVWTAEDEPSTKNPPQWLDGNEENRRLAAATLCQHTAPEDHRPMARTVTSQLRRAVDQGGTPPGHAGEVMSGKVTQHLEIITQEAEEGLKLGGVEGVEKLDNVLQELHMMHLLISRFPNHGHCAGNAQMIRLVQEVWEAEAQRHPHEPAIRREIQREGVDAPQMHELLPLEGFKYISVNASDVQSIFEQLTQIAAAMITDRETAGATNLAISTKQPNRDSELLVQPYLVVAPDAGVSEQALARNVAAINCAIRYATAIWPSITHDEFQEA